MFNHHSTDFTRVVVALELYTCIARGIGDKILFTPHPGDFILGRTRHREETTPLFMKLSGALGEPVATWRRGSRASICAETLIAIYERHVLQPRETQRREHRADSLRKPTLEDLAVWY